MNYTGVIIEESLKDKTILAGLRILKTNIEKTIEEDNTPWLNQWTMHTVEIPSQSAERWAEMISRSLEDEHPWFADFKNNNDHFVIYRDRYFKVNLHSPDYSAVRRHGLLLGIPDYQLNF